MILVAFLLAADTGALAGKVSLEGLAPRLSNLPVTKDNKVCGNSKPDESLEVKNGGVKNAVVWLLDVGEAKTARAEKEKLDQQQCQFVPHVVVAPQGSTIDVVNSDRALHTVRAQAGDGKLMNYAMPIPGHVVPTRLKKDGIFRVSCDVHPWMRAWIAVLPTTAYALTGEDGRYRIDGVPAGKHRVRIWHERLGEREADVVVPPSGTVTHDVRFTSR